jgi:hypothetical protein
MNLDFDPSGYVDLILSSGQFCDITVEAPVGTPPSTAMGGTDRSQSWPTIASDVPCIERPMASSLNRAMNDERQQIIDTRFYFHTDPVPSPGGISSRHRITRGQAIYAVLGKINSMSFGTVIQVDAQKVRTP